MFLYKGLFRSTLVYVLLLCSLYSSFFNPGEDIIQILAPGIYIVYSVFNIIEKHTLYIISGLNLCFYKLTPIIIILYCDYLLYNITEINFILTFIYISSLLTVYLLYNNEITKQQETSLLEKIKFLFKNKYLLVTYIIIATIFRNYVMSDIVFIENNTYVITTFIIMINTYLPINIIYKSLVFSINIMPVLAVNNNTNGLTEILYKDIKLCIEPKRFVYLMLMVFIIVNIKAYIIFCIIPILQGMYNESVIDGANYNDIISNVLVKIKGKIKLDIYTLKTNTQGEFIKISSRIKYNGYNANSPLPKHTNNINTLPIASYDNSFECKTNNQDIKLDGSHHANTINYCPVGKSIIRIQAVKEGLNPDLLQNEMQVKRVTCYDVCKSIPVMNNRMIEFNKYNLKLEPANLNTDVHNASLQLALAISSNLVIKTPAIITSHGKFDRMGPHPLTLKFSDVKSDLSIRYIKLISECIKSNISHYPNILTYDTTISDDSIITDSKLGYKIPNLINALGLDEAKSAGHLAAQKVDVLNIDSNVVRASIFKNKTRSDFNKDHPLMKLNNLDPMLHTDHSSVIGFCRLGQTLIGEKALTKGLTSKDLEVKLEKSNVECNDLFKRLPSTNGMVHVLRNPLDLQPKNTNPEVAYLAEKVASLVTKKALSNLPIIKFNGKSFSGIGKPDFFVYLKDIKMSLSVRDVLLFNRCVSVNPSCYQGIQLHNGIASDECVIFSNLIGYKIPNNLNKFGTISQKNKSGTLKVNNTDTANKKPRIT